MYCVKCGVKLQDHVEKCPLCQTPVWNPDAFTAGDPIYPPRLPEKKDTHLAVAIIISVIAALGAFIVYLVGSHVSGIWSGITMLGIALFYLILVLPIWFPHLHPGVYFPVTHAATAGYLLYICHVTGGHWFLSFAMPIVLILCVIITTIAVLLRHVRHGRFFIFGSLFIALGIFNVLLELFEHITFALPMFLWSPYSAGALTLFGLFLILAGIIPPLRHFLEKNFFF